MKNVKVNFALAMVIIIVIALAAVLCATGAAIISKTLDSTVEALDEERLSDDEIDDVEGYGYIIRYIGAGASWVAELVLWVMAVIAGIYAVLLFAFALAARLSFSTGKNVLLAYRILMGIEYGLQGILECQIIRMLFDGFSVVLFVAIVVLTLEIVFSARNTYSDRILS